MPINPKYNLNLQIKIPTKIKVKKQNQSQNLNQNQNKNEKTKAAKTVDLETHLHKSQQGYFQMDISKDKLEEGSKVKIDDNQQQTENAAHLKINIQKNLIGEELNKQVLKDLIKRNQLQKLKKLNQIHEHKISFLQLNFLNDEFCDDEDSKMIPQSTAISPKIKQVPYYPKQNSPASSGRQKVSQVNHQIPHFVDSKSQMYNKYNVNERRSRSLQMQIEMNSYHQKHLQNIPFQIQQNGQTSSNFTQTSSSKFSTQMPKQNNSKTQINFFSQRNSKQKVIIIKNSKLEKQIQEATFTSYNSKRPSFCQTNKEDLKIFHKKTRHNQESFQILRLIFFNLTSFSHSQG
eukprot:TRINITY_DN11088_c0_g1_i2.p1 TRINITY_DN11088_c0_g1~~TRINITY_DN11088_c0_g1_i2.p1  ORF type:complete len:346 (+),score=45.65 TRINITY_DN11088_c0_g1_i2:662-1699(+)